MGFTGESNTILHRWLSARAGASVVCVVGGRRPGDAGFTEVFRAIGELSNHGIAESRMCRCDMSFFHHLSTLKVSRRSPWRGRPLCTKRPDVCCAEPPAPAPIAIPDGSFVIRSSLNSGLHFSYTRPHGVPTSVDAAMFLSAGSSGYAECFASRLRRSQTASRQCGVVPRSRVVV